MVCKIFLAKYIFSQVIQTFNIREMRAREHKKSERDCISEDDWIPFTK